MWCWDAGGSSTATTAFASSRASKGEELRDAAYTYTNRLVANGMAFLEWTAEATHARVRDGADSLIEDGWLVAQTIHYTVEWKRPSS